VYCCGVRTPDGLHKATYRNFIIMTVRGLITTQSGTDCVSKEHGSHFARTSAFTDGSCINLLKPNDIYTYRTVALTSRRYILNIYSTNIRTEYFKMLHNLRFFLFKMPFIS